MNIKYLKDKLLRDPVRNANIINFIEDYGISKFEEAGNSILIKGTSDRDWIYFSSTDENEFRILLSKLNLDDCNFAVIEDWMIPVMNEKFNIEIELSTIKLYYPSYLTVPNVSEYLIPLSPSDAEYVYNNYSYKEYTTPEYIRDRIIKNPGAGIRDNDKLAAWILTQDDGAIGILHVLDKYRRRGFAKQLTWYMINDVRKRGRIPFVQIEKNNFKSIRLAENIGFIEDRVVHWGVKSKVQSPKFKVQSRAMYNVQCTRLCNVQRKDSFNPDCIGNLYLNSTWSVSNPIFSGKNGIRMRLE